jgi:hypothetical protein
MASALQHAYMRPMGVISMLISVDEERGPSLFKVGEGGHAACVWGGGGGLEASTKGGRTESKSL